MAWVAFALCVLAIATTGGLRTWLHYRATGDTGNQDLVAWSRKCAGGEGM